ncbi:recombination endonuclease [Synechococcus phage S-CBM2]|nr:recombination endonuclease [Synechococcus phage S-CBM2]
MIVFEKIRWKNFLSTGNQFTEVKLNPQKGTLIVGQNGAGKSTILDALCFVLFNKPFRKINKPQLVNSINEKDCLVEVEFVIGKNEYLIRRGIKPTKFDIIRNGELVDQDAASKDYQSYLEKNILQLTYKSFTQVVILGSSTFVPFMQLPAAHRREVIEDLLDIRIFSAMNNLLKDRVKSNEVECRDLERDITFKSQQIEMQEEHIDEVQSNNKARIISSKQKCDELIKQSELLQEQVRTLNDIYKTKNLELGEMSSDISKMDQLKSFRWKIEDKIKTSQKDLDFYTKNHQCPTCTQEIDPKFRSSKIAELDSKNIEYQSALNKLMTQAQDLQCKVDDFKEKSEDLTTLSVEIQNKNFTISKNHDMISEKEREILQLEEQLNSQSASMKKLKLFTQELGDLKDKLSSTKKLQDSYSVISSLLKDDGIKSKIVKTYIPAINQRINSRLQSMDFFVNFTLDEEFNEVIKSRFRDDFTYSSFSEGEKQKIDLALLFTWRSIAKMKNSVSTNLLILDEVFDSSLDATGTEDLLKILRDLSEDTNIFVISHKGEMLVDKFPRIIKFEKQQDFSKLIVEET